MPLRLVIAFATFGSLSSAAFAAEFHGLGLLPGRAGTAATAVSADGSTVVGYGYWTQEDQGATTAFRWTATSGLQALGHELGGADRHSAAQGVSRDGSLIAGLNDNTSTALFLWTAETGYTAFGADDPNISPYSISEMSGTGMVVGIGLSPSGGEAYSWTADRGLARLGDLPGDIFYSWAFGVSDDSSTVVGFSNSGLGEEAFRWTETTGMVGLGDIAGGGFLSRARDVSADGTVVVGHGLSSSGQEAFRWTEATGMVGLGDFEGGDHLSEAVAVNSDGSIVVGMGLSGNGHLPFIWDEAHGMRNLIDVMTNEYGLGPSLAGWKELTITDISADGRVLVGYGEPPQGGAEAWRAVLDPLPVPEPSSLLLAAFGMIGLLLGIRRCRFSSLH